MKSNVRRYLQIVFGIAGMGSGLFLNNTMAVSLGAILLLLWAYEVILTLEQKVKSLSAK